MPQGLVALSKFQAGLEATRGTAVPATRIQPLNGWFVENVDRAKIHEQRNSFIDIFRSIQVKRWVELRGLTTSPTYEDLPWFLQSFLKGGVAGVLSATTVYTYTFTPTAAADDLKTVTWEVGNDTQAFQVPFGLGQRLEMSFGGEKPAAMTCDYLGQKANKQAFTGALSDRVTEDINGENATCSIDSTTIGTTQVPQVLTAKFSIENNWEQLFRLDGNLFPGDAYRKPRSAQLEITLQFASTTEYDAFVTAPAERKVRLLVPGSVIAGSTGNVQKLLQIDWYGFWDTAPISDQNGLHIVTLTGTSHYDTGATADWSVAVKNGLVTLP
jgi:hypothetical protein